jgi:hypothetical protein
VSDPFAPPNTDGLKPYVVEKSSWGRSWSRIEYAENLKVAKDKHGWTREHLTSVKVRRARLSDVEATS